MKESQHRNERHYDVTRVSRLGPTARREARSRERWRTAVRVAGLLGVMALMMVLATRVSARQHTTERAYDQQMESLNAEVKMLRAQTHVATDQNPFTQSTLTVCQDALARLMTMRDSVKGTAAPTPYYANVVRQLLVDAFDQAVLAEQAWIQYSTTRDEASKRAALAAESRYDTLTQVATYQARFGHRGQDPLPPR